MRSGTENVPAIVGWEATRLATARAGIGKNRKLREELWRGIKKVYPRANVNGVSELRITNYELDSLIF